MMETELLANPEKGHVDVVDGEAPTLVGQTELIPVLPGILGHFSRHRKGEIAFLPVVPEVQEVTDPDGFGFGADIDVDVGDEVPRDPTDHFLSFEEVSADRISSGKNEFVRFPDSILGEQVGESACFTEVDAMTVYVQQPGTVPFDLHLLESIHEPETIASGEAGGRST